MLPGIAIRRNAPQFLYTLCCIEEVNPMTFNPVTPLTSVEKKGRFLTQSQRQQSRNRQRSMLMRTIQQVAPDQV